MTTTKQIATEIQSQTGNSLVFINSIAMNYVLAGLCATREEALNYIKSSL